MSQTYNLSQSEVIVLPNPSFDGSFEIRADDDYDRIELYDMMGRLLFKDHYNAQQKYSIPDASSGMKLVKLISDKRKQMICKLLMVQ